MEWPFEDPRRTAVFTLRAIVFQGSPILSVIHDHDGDWQFLDGVTDATIENHALVALENIARLDPSVMALADLPCGWQAWRRDESEG